jgi:predicted nuclease with TOPRIM domain
MPSIGYDAREAQNEILRMLETVIREKDALIQELTFKLGKIEADFNNTVPRIDHKKTILALEEAHSSRIHDMELLNQAKVEIESKYQKEKLISTVLMIGVFVLLCACVVLAFHFFSLRGAVPNTL